MEMATDYRIAALLLLFASPTTFSYQASAGAGSTLEYAAVNDVKLQTRIVQVPVAREECWEEPVTYHAPPVPGYHSYTSTIAGGIAGAVVGHQFGSGSGRDLATVAGTALGASIGRDYEARRRYAPRSVTTTTQQRCRIVNEYQSEERADGYLVSYTYNGRQYQTTTRTHPGDRIQVRVDVSPVPY